MQIHEEVVFYSPEELHAHPLNDMYHSPLDDGEYAALYSSIEELGIQEPLWITPNKMIISGHERWKIAKKLNLIQIPTRKIENATEQDLIYLLVSANEARRGTEKDLIKRAKKARVMYEHWGIKHGGTRSQSESSRHDVDLQMDRHDVAKMFGVTDRTVQRLLKLLELIPELQDCVSDEIIGLTAGNDLAALPVIEQQRIYEFIKKHDLKEVKTTEIQAIKNELESIRERDPNRNEQQIELSSTVREEEYESLHDYENNYEEHNQMLPTTLHQDHEESMLEERLDEHFEPLWDEDPNPIRDYRDLPTVQERKEPTEQRPWHSTVEGPKRTMDVVAPLFEDNSNAVNVRKRLFKEQVKKAEKQIDSITRGMAPFYDLIIDHSDVIIRDAMNSLLKQIESLNSQLEEVVSWRERRR